MVKRQSGFTLIELLIALIIMSLMTAMLVTYFGPWATYKARVDTQNKLALLQEALTDAYKDNALTIDSNAGAAIVLPNGKISSTASATPATFQPIMPYSSTAPLGMARDGYGKALTVFVSDLLSKKIAGATLYYHVIAVVSSGARSRGPAKSTFDPSTGALKLDPYETAVLINGYDIEYAIYRTTRTRLQQLANLYSTYFQSRYMGDSGRSYGVDYFACGGNPCGASSSPSWDITGTVGNSLQRTNQTAAQVNLQTTLGLSHDDVTDGWGNPIYVDNDSSAVRSPSNPSAAMQTPPYTATLYANMPGGQRLSVTAAGNY
ncbi:MAG TPA: hypothetical protein DEP05_01815 [Betaproteobacteria bacterium]|nr:hypothetical protein [Betaproteobacteria bacterium]